MNLKKFIKEKIAIGGIQKIYNKKSIVWTIEMPLVKKDDDWFGEEIYIKKIFILITGSKEIIETDFMCNSSGEKIEPKICYGEFLTKFEG